MAKKWGIHTVTIDWLFDSLKKKYAVDEGLYDPAELLKDPKKPKGSSTPTEGIDTRCKNQYSINKIIFLSVKHRDRLSMGIDLDCSAIGGARANMTVCSNASMSGNRTLVNETISSADRTAKPNKPVAKLIPNMDATTLEASKVMAPPATVVKAPRNKKVSSLQSTSEAIDKDETPIELLDLTVSTSGSFLDNCRIYVNGFNGQSTEILRKIINAGGGTRLNKLDASVTHFIVGKRPNESDLRKVKDNQLKCHVIDHRWLSQSFKRSKLQPVEPYFVEGFEPKQIITEEKAPTNPAKK